MNIPLNSPPSPFPSSRRRLFPASILLERTKKEQKNPVVAAISKPYKGMRGIGRSYEEAAKLFGIASASGASAFTMPDEVEEKVERTYSEDAEMLIINAVRKNAEKELKEAFVHFIYNLPGEERESGWFYFRWRRLWTRRGNEPARSGRDGKCRIYI